MSWTDYPFCWIIQLIVKFVWYQFTPFFKNLIFNERYIDINEFFCKFIVSFASHFYIVLKIFCKKFKRERNTVRSSVSTKGLHIKIGFRSLAVSTSKIFNSLGPLILYKFFSSGDLSANCNLQKRRNMACSLLIHCDAASCEVSFPKELILQILKIKKK